MPFTRYKTTFDPETLHALQQAFDMAWRDIALMPIVRTDPDSALELLPQRIVAAAKEAARLDGGCVSGVPKTPQQQAVVGF